MHIQVETVTLHPQRERLFLSMHCVHLLVLAFLVFVSSAFANMSNLNLATDNPSMNITNMNDLHDCVTLKAVWEEG